MGCKEALQTVAAATEAVTMLVVITVSTVAVDAIAAVAAEAVSAAFAAVVGNLHSTLRGSLFIFDCSKRSFFNNFRKTVTVRQTEVSSDDNSNNTIFLPLPVAVAVVG